MAHLFMLVVILALLPAAIQTAIALGILAWHLFLGALAIGAVIFLLYHPELLSWLIAIGGGFAAIIWTASKIEASWPGGPRETWLWQRDLRCCRTRDYHRHR